MLSPDGQWFWDGAQWRAAYSPDRRWRWDGGRWVPAPPQRWRYQHPEWTRRLQVIVLLLTTLGILAAIISAPTVLLPLMQQSMDQAVRTQQAEPGVDPAQLQAIMQTTLYATLGLSAAFGAAFVVVTVVGTLKLWRWVYWLLAVVYLLALVGIVQDIDYLLGVGSISLPRPWLVLSLLSGLAEGALGIWMIVLSRRYGTWARTRVPLQA
ncbi:MAG: hypothetical protein J2P45_16815 [Candidatus Dormibacteraeota bacterium]|nr:hypothetical protein [Candidatus Dormibacteraeota bacterium]